MEFEAREIPINLLKVEKRRKRNDMVFGLGNRNYPPGTEEGDISDIQFSRERTSLARTPPRTASSSLGKLTAEKKVKSQLSNLEKEDLKRFRELEKQRASRERIQSIGRAGFQVGRSVGEFGRAGAQGMDMSAEQEALHSMFGGGEKIWGTRGEPVRINNDLHPSVSDPEDETRSMFGF